MRQLPLPELCRKVCFREDDAAPEQLGHAVAWSGWHTVNSWVNAPLGLAVCTSPLLGLREKYDSYLEEGQDETFDTELKTVGTTEAT